MGLPEPGPHTTCLVTGASSGIGAHIARELAARRLGLVLVARRRDRLQALADELSAAHRVRVEVVPADLADERSRAALPDAVADLGLTVEVLVNNAGLTTLGPVHRADRQAELRVVRTDVEAVVDLCTMFVPGMATRRRGAVLNTASTAAFQPLPGQAVYGGSKAFVVSYTYALRAELRPAGVAVTALCPGPVETGFAEAAGMSEAEAASALPRFMWVPADQVARAGVEGLDHDRAIVIPGAANRLGAVGAQLAPRSVVTAILARQHPGLQGTAPDR
ncbi:MAG TPA: SDR family oxidoreductase [Acidimicrobiales bacterium]|nr:SDR family oxidoreductase [Acidimicrobiales bacterium]